MLSETYLQKYADVLVWGLITARAGRFRKGDIVSIHYESAATPLAEALYKNIIKMGLNAVLRYGMSSSMEKTFYVESGLKQLKFIPPGDKEFYAGLNGGIHLRAPESLTHLKEADPKRIGAVALSRKHLRDILRDREEKGLYGWTSCMMATEAMAQHAGMTLKQYEDAIVKACYLDTKDPVGEWKRILKDSSVIKKWLNKLPVEKFHVESANCDLFIKRGKHRRWLGVSGHNIPSFELFMSPDWHETEGVYYADQPSYRSGNYVEGVKLYFKNGRVEKVDAKTGGDFVRAQIAIDAGAKSIGEFSLTDKRFSKINKFMANTLFDENFGGEYGNCHIALGASYTDTFDGDPSALTKKNKVKLGFNDSALHWDLVNTEAKRVSAILEGGGKIVIYENGVFTLN